jgi:hypothetical protein
LVLAAEVGNADVVKSCLLVPGVDVNALVVIRADTNERSDKAYKRSALVAIAQRGSQLQMTRLLMEANADPGLPDSEGVCASLHSVTDLLLLRCCLLS